MYLASAFKVRKYSHVAIRNSCDYNLFPFVKPGSKNGKSVCLVQAFLLADCNRTRTHNHLVRKHTLNYLAKLGFPIYLKDHVKFKCCLDY